MNPILFASPASQWSADEVAEKKDFIIMLLESLLILCQRRNMREELRKKKVYPIIRNVDVELNDDKVSSVVFELVQMLMRDEEPLPIQSSDSKGCDLDLEAVD